MDTERHCPSCRKPLPANAPKGLCPECLMKAGFGSGVAPEAGQPSRTPPFVPPAVTEVGRLFPQFEILELLGQGGMGAVYKARQPALDRLVALKILPPETGADSGFADRFTREARALARLNHPNIVGVYEFGQAGGLHYFVMEYVEGLNLRQLEQAGRLSPREALKIIPQICDALQFAHDEGIVHRDIKPENVMLDKKGRVKIADFGLAKILGRGPETLRLTGAKDVMGTPHYMAPEQVERPQEVDHRADIYSLGVVFYEMLTGELPLGRFAPPSRKVQVDVRLDEVVLHALEKEPERRYQQASQVKTAVETIAATSAPVPAPEMNHWQPAILLVAGLVSAGVLLIATAAPPPLCWLGFLFGSFGLIVAVLKLAGIWPYPSGLFPQSNFTGRNLPGRKRMTSSTATEPRFSRTAIWGAVWAPLSFIAVLLVLVSYRVTVAPGSTPSGPAWWQIVLGLTLLPLGLTAPFGTTILGGIAILQIKHSRGRLHGLGLAVFDVLLFPLLALNGGLVAGWSWLPDQVAPEWMPHIGRAWFSTLVVGLMITSCVVASWLIIRAVWKAANRAPAKGRADVVTAGAWAPRSRSPWGIVAAVAGVTLLIAVLAGMLALAASRYGGSKQPRVTTYDPDRIAAVEQKLTSEAAGRLREANYRFDGVFVNVVNAHYDLVQCEIRGLRKAVSEGLRDGAPVQLFDALSGGLDFQHTGNGLWAVRGNGSLTNLNFTVDTSAEMGPPQKVVTTLPKPFQYPEPEEPDTATRLAQNRAKSQPTARSRYPKAAHIGRNNYSVMIRHDDVDLHYALFYAGEFNSSSSGSHNTRSQAWTDDGSLKLKSGRTFGYLREATDPDHLRINGQEYDLRRGRVFTLHDDGTAEQMALFPSLAVARDPEQLAGLIATPREPVQASAKASSRDALSEADRVRAVALFNDIEDFGHEFEAAFASKSVPAAETGTRRLLNLLSNFNAVVRGTGYEFSPGMFADIGKVQQALKPGDWDKVQQAARGNDAYRQEFKRIAGRMVELAREHKQAAATSLGPVVERVVAGKGDANKRFIDLDTGRQFAAAEFFGPKAEPSPAETQKWWRDTGTDAMGDTSPHIRGLVGFEMVASPVPTEEWERLPPSRLDYYLTMSAPGTPVTMSGKGELPATYAVKTREGAQGLLQIVGFNTNDPPEVRIRYMLVQPGRTNAAALPPAASVRCMEANEARRYWRWQVRRPTPARLICGVLEVADPQHPQRVLWEIEGNSSQGVQDYVLRVDPERDKWRVEVEGAWTGETGGRGAVWQYLRCQTDANVTGTSLRPPGTLTTTNYTVLWRGEIATRGRALKSLCLVARLAEAGDPVADILGASDPVRVVDGTPVAGWR